jgi:hypothetical protein
MPYQSMYQPVHVTQGLVLLSHPALSLEVWRSTPINLTRIVSHSPWIVHLNAAVEASMKSEVLKWKFQSSSDDPAVLANRGKLSASLIRDLANCTSR